jgi:biopolymer transport protein ExbD
MDLRRRRTACAAIAEQPFSTINTTPIIDVMLVLLIMFIITLPTTTNSVKIDLPQGPPPSAPVMPETHQLTLDSAGRVGWDGAPIAGAALRRRLADFHAGAPDGILYFRTDAKARYEDFDRVLADVKRSGIDRLGFLGNDRFERAY